MVAAEHDFPVRPLPVPTPNDDVGAAAYPPCPAMELFIQRALAVRPDLALTPANRAAIAQICIRLEGLPLAIELAATRTKLLSPPAIAARLERRLPLLTTGGRNLPPRHQTLRAALAWSYDLLACDVQALFRRLAVFTGGFTLDAAAAVVAEDDARASDLALLNRLAVLVDHSLLEREDQTDGEPRFAMLETVREHGAELMAAAGETPVLESKTLWGRRAGPVARRL